MMSRIQRIVLDNNVVVSRILSAHGACANVFDLVYDSCILLTSEPVLAELREVIEREKFDRYVEAAARREFISRYAAAAKLVRVLDVVLDCRDATDNMLLELALSGRADAIVSGDRDLLCLHPWRGIAIVSPADYLALCK
jgi:putative PIN family toxin of toxin-antitoxin system